VEADKSTRINNTCEYFTNDTTLLFAYTYPDRDDAREIPINKRKMVAVG
jgi:hypothetical protein